MRFVWAILCSKQVVDPLTNVVSLLDVVDLVQIPPSEAEKVQGPIEGAAIRDVKLQIIVFWTRRDRDSPETGLMSLCLRTPSGRKIDRSDIPVDLEESISARTQVLVSALPYEGPGTYEFLVRQRVGNRWRRVAALPLHIEIGEPEKSMPSNVEIKKLTAKKKAKRKAKRKAP